jgi:hypothetical protein
MTTIRVRKLTEYCPTCQALTGAPCVELIRFKLNGERVPLRFTSTWHDIVEYAPTTS